MSSLLKTVKYTPFSFYELETSEVIIAIKHHKLLNFHKQRMRHSRSSIVHRLKSHIFIQLFLFLTKWALLLKVPKSLFLLRQLWWMRPTQPWSTNNWEVKKPNLLCQTLLRRHSRWGIPQRRRRNSWKRRRFQRKSSTLIKMEMKIQI